MPFLETTLKYSCRRSVRDNPHQNSKRTAFVEATYIELHVKVRATHSVILDVGFAIIPGLVENWETMAPFMLEVGKEVSRIAPKPGRVETKIDKKTSHGHGYSCS